MRVIGTAGHVDHGKSTLVEALTGTHPDRLKEEQAREMTIDLGFAWLKLPETERLPDADEIGIVDVPGHRDFIENMLAGIGGIDAALFVVAADEGVMPQTREHLAILDLLQIPTGVVALTKIDMVDDPEWIDLVEFDLHQVLQGTVLADAPVVRVSGTTGQGVSELIKAIAKSLADRPPRPDLGRARLPIDRIFTIAGFGTVVTGTLSDGLLRVGEEVAVMPGEKRGRIRGLQSHGRVAEVAVPGGRTAVNISGVDVDQLERGDVVTHPGDYAATRRIDVRFRLLPDVDLALKHDMEVKLFIGAKETIARLRLLGEEVLSPGEEGWLQLELRKSIVTNRGDRYILRRPSPGETLGGGIVVDPYPAGRHKRFSTEVLTRLDALATGTPEDILRETAQALGAAALRDIVAEAGLPDEQVLNGLPELLRTGDLIPLEEGNLDPNSKTLVASRGNWSVRSEEILASVKEYHLHHPLRLGMPKEELRSKLGLSPRLFTAFVTKLGAEETIKDSGPLLYLPGHHIQFTSTQQKAVDGLIRQFAAQPNAPPSVKESQATVGEDIFGAMLDLEMLVQVSPDVVFRREDYDRLRRELRDYLGESGTITVAQVRDRYQTSRKYALALLEHLDEIGDTVRDGDVRRLRGGPKDTLE